MQGKICLEEHLLTLDASPDSYVGTKDRNWPAIRERLLDIQKIRIEDMDKYGVELMVLSLNPTPAIQAILDVNKAIDVAKRSNDFLAGEISKNPNRFAGFAALPLQDPDAATLELQRCVKEYGFKGALVNGYTQVNNEDNCYYYDMPQYWPFWAEVEKLDVPIYVHPRTPIKSQGRIYEGHEGLLRSPWGFSVETATHMLRLMDSGLFDAYPGLNIILGHLGEMLPSNIWRTTHRLIANAHEARYKRSFSEYLINNFYVSTSGNFRLSPFLAAMLEMGSDRIMFSTDYPFEEMSEAAAWFDNVEISEAERLKIGRLNAIKLLKLDL